MTYVAVHNTSLEYDCQRARVEEDRRGARERRRAVVVTDRRSKTNPAGDRPDVRRVGTRRFGRRFRCRSRLWHSRSSGRVVGPSRSTHVRRPKEPRMDLIRSGAHRARAPGVSERATTPTRRHVAVNRPGGARSPASRGRRPASSRVRDHDAADVRARGRQRSRPSASGPG